VSKYNTFLQLCLMGITTISTLLPFSIAMPLLALQCVRSLSRCRKANGGARWTVAGTTIWSGLSYLTSKGVKVL
jgi:cardiolipin synthase